MDPAVITDAVRQVLGFFLCGGLLWGFFVWLAGGNRRSAGDLLAGTVILHDPGERQAE